MSKTVYETAAVADFATQGVGTSNQSAANIYMIASPTADAENVNVNIEFELPANKYLKKTDGTVIGGTSATKFYLGLQLTPQTYNVFVADYVTYLNATVKNWGIASKTPVVVTDAEIGVVFNVEWQEGNIYNVEI